MRDDAPTPPTLAQVQGYGVDIFCYCNRCHHHAVLPVAIPDRSLRARAAIPAGAWQASQHCLRITGHSRAAELEGVRASGRAWAIQMV
jgi:hypothetical protein